MSLSWGQSHAWLGLAVLRCNRHIELRPTSAFYSLWFLFHLCVGSCRNSSSSEQLRSISSRFRSAKKVKQPTNDMVCILSSMCARVMSYSSVSLNALLVIALQNSDALSSILRQWNVLSWYIPMLTCKLQCSKTDFVHLLAVFNFNKFAFIIIKCATTGSCAFLNVIFQEW